MEEKVILVNRVYDVKEAAALIGIHPETVREYCRTGAIKCKRLKEWKIMGQDLIDFMNTDLPVRNPGSGVEETAKVFDKGSKLPITENSKGEFIKLNDE